MRRVFTAQASALGCLWGQTHSPPADQLQTYLLHIVLCACVYMCVTACYMEACGDFCLL